MPSQVEPGFSALLRQYRKAAGRTQKALGAAAGCTAIAVQKLEAGARRPSPDMAAALARSLNLRDTERKQFLNAAVAANGDERKNPQSLPQWHTSWVPRHQDLERLVGLLLHGHARLLTLQGSGGSGKTRLAVMAARRVAYFFRHGIVFVPLADVAHATQVPAAIARALTLRLQPGESETPAIAKLLQRRRMLLILDNCEHVRAAAPEIKVLLDSCPSLRILATSRVPLELEGEQLVSPSALSRAESSMLFLDRARLSMPGFQPDATARKAIAAICDALGGLPLAIELAAARCSGLSINLIARQLVEGTPGAALGMLAHGPVGLPDRQRSMDAVLAWSFNLLNAQEQACLLCLGVCRGVMSPDLIAAVSGTELDATLSHVSALARLGFLQPVGDGEYEMSAVVRAFCLSPAHSPQIRAAAEHRRLAHLERLMITVRPMLSHGDRIQLGLQTVRRNIENVRGAAAWGLENGQALTVARMASSMAHAMWHLGWAGECLHLLEAAIPGLQPPADGHLRALSRALSAAGSMAAAQMQLARARVHFAGALRINRESKDQAAVSVVLANFAEAERMAGDYAAAEQLLQESLSLSRNMEDAEYIAIDLAMTAQNALAQQQTDRAMALLAEAFVAGRHSPATQCELQCLMAHAYMVQSRYTDAIALLQQAHELARDTDAPVVRATVSRLLGFALLADDKRPAARQHLDFALHAFSNSGRIFQAAGTLNWLGDWLLKQGRHAEGMRLWGAAESVATRLCFRLEPSPFFGTGQRRDAAELKLGAQRASALMVEGSTMTVDQVRSRLANLLA